MKKVFINGSSGKMGQAVSDNLKKHNFDETDKILDCDVAIDFSHPDTLNEIIDECVLNDKPLIIGTTGLSDQDFKVINAACGEIPIVYASNFSNGILNLKKSISDFLSNSNGEYHCEIEEVHHNQKKDFPSGTAVDIRKFINQNDKKKLVKSLKTISLRQSDIFGIHKVIFKNNDQYLEFEHEALSREVFVTGALHAARKIMELSPNLYSIDEF
jgi:4-hydroxy-tetrahydrodipicolinate reductase